MYVFHGFNHNTSFILHMDYTVSCQHRITWMGLLTKMIITVLKEVKSYTCVDKLNSCIASSDKPFPKTKYLIYEK